MPRIPAFRSPFLPQSKLLSSSTVDLSCATYDYRKDTLYATKGVALLCGEPMVHAAWQVLTAMHAYICRTDFDLQVGMTFGLF